MVVAAAVCHSRSMVVSDSSFFTPASCARFDSMSVSFFRSIDGSKSVATVGLSIPLEGSAALSIVVGAVGLATPQASIGVF